MIEFDTYRVEDDGRIVFSDQGLKELRPYFARAGIDIRSVRTYRDYLEARRRASPFFLDFLRDRIAKGKPSLERRALLAIVDGDDEVYERTLRQLMARQKLNVV
ncbi:hypothetical protein [Methylocaldum sp. RMAD-M]|jgi:hypothetical protein|uniref:hypothetical protein n=1 Tax=Methylocaldum sp. RMAD-M TaxID=2806557 RepID=UPI0012EBD3FE|nr:hypothetical protein [Methylocaldum sp. RMAD-M]MBP1151271.1 hypothetical protein [Methylocaldum sp. RMAD-M]MVF24154.1 hypothetical protein [Methylocaldum sp. BRCS4]